VEEVYAKVLNYFSY